MTRSIDVKNIVYENLPSAEDNNNLALRIAKSTERIGYLLHPIGVKERPEKDLYDLVYGKYRFKAVKDILGWKRIECLVLNDEESKLAKLTENLDRKDIKDLERIKLNVEMLKLTGEIQTAPRSETHLRKTRLSIEDIAPKICGRAWELIGKTKISKDIELLANIAALEEEDQVLIVTDLLAHDITFEAALRTLRITQKMRGQAIPDHLINVFTKEYLRVKKLYDLADAFFIEFSLTSNFSRTEKISALNTNLKNHISSSPIRLSLMKIIVDAIPFAICPFCKGSVEACKNCNYDGWINKEQADIYGRQGKVIKVVQL
jgi:hypothetical protein